MGAGRVETSVAAGEEHPVKRTPESWSVRCFELRAVSLALAERAPPCAPVLLQLLGSSGTSVRAALSAGVLRGDALTRGTRARKGRFGRFLYLVVNDL